MEPIKLKIDVPDYPWDGGVLVGAKLKGRWKGRDVPVLIMGLADLMEKRERLKYSRGCPVYIAHDPKAKRVWLFPTPDGEYELLTEGKPEEQQPGTLNAPVMQPVKVAQGPVAGYPEGVAMPQTGEASRVGTLHVPPKSRAADVAAKAKALLGGGDGVQKSEKAGPT